MDNLLYFDVEYANSKNKSICQIGLMIENKINSNPPFPELELFVNPEDEFDSRCVSVHHITKDKVVDKKTFIELWKDIEKYFINSIIVGHNVASSDLDALCKNLIRYNIPFPEFYYVDTLEIAKDVLDSNEVFDFSLSTLCKYFDIDIGEEHNAFDDACSCSDLLKFFIKEFQIDVDDYVHHYEFGKTFEFSPFIDSLILIRELNYLLGNVDGILSDGIISEEETASISQWYEKHKLLRKNKYATEIYKLLDSILLDKIITFDEARRLQSQLINTAQDFSSSIETKATQILQGLTQGIKADSVINDDEIISLQKWLYENDYLMGHFPYNKIKEKIDQILEDRVITNSERNELFEFLDDVFKPVKEIVDKVLVFNNKEFCLSGDFEHGTKGQISKYIESKGGHTVDSIKIKTTDYVVVGQYGSDKYSNGNYGTKVKKAKEHGIPVITEKQLFNQ